jgi:hypothetical protein
MDKVLARLRRKLTLRLATTVALGLALAITAAPSSAGAAVLYDQTTGTPGASVPVGNQGGVIGFAADDFTVPAGATWRIDSFDLLGSLSGSGTSFGDFRSSVDADANGVPGVSGFNFDADYWRFGALPAGNVLTVALRHAVLGAGTYWLEAGTQDNDPTWSWTSQSPRHGNEGVWENLAPAPCSHAFMPLSACGQPGPDLRFRVNGEPISPTFTLGKQTRYHKNGGVTIAVSFPLRGRVAVEDAGRADLMKGFDAHLFGKEPLDVGLRVTPTKRVKRQLKSHKVKRVKAKVKITYEPEMVNPPPADQLTQTVKVVIKPPG